MKQTWMGTWYEPYELDDCPQCGGLLEPPDYALCRHCLVCHIYIGPAKVELTEEA